MQTRRLKKASQITGISNLSNYEKNNVYFPNRFPHTKETIGIEVVAEYVKGSGFESPTPQQKESIKKLINDLKKYIIYLMRIFINMMIFPTKHLAKAMVYINSAIIILILNFLHAETFNEIKIITVSKSIVDNDASPAEKYDCDNWNLNKKQIKEIISISEIHENDGRESLYYHIPCDTFGVAIINGKIWKYNINAGGMTDISNKNKTVKLGCFDEKCKSLVILFWDQKD